MRISLLASSVAVAVALIPASAMAKPDNPMKDQGTSLEAAPMTLDGSATTDSSGDLAVAAVPSTSVSSPSNCWGYARNPHISTKDPTFGDIKGNAETICDRLPSRISVKASVWRDRWWGYQQMGDVGYGETSTRTSINRSGHWDGCDNNTWRTVGNHVSYEFGDKFSAETMNYQEITGC